MNSVLTTIHKLSNKNFNDFVYLTSITPQFDFLIYSLEYGSPKTSFQKLIRMRFNLDQDTKRHKNRIIIRH